MPNAKDRETAARLGQRIFGLNRVIESEVNPIIEEIADALEAVRNETIDLAIELCPGADINNGCQEFADKLTHGT
jgi:hypothetical protein